MTCLEKYQWIRPWVELGTLILAAVAGVATAYQYFVANLFVHYVTAIAAGVVYGFLVWVTYKYWLFTYGLPDPDDKWPTKTSNLFYGVTARRHFFLYWKWMTATFLTFAAIRWVAAIGG